ncbi:MAG: RluA family pseudouridine synthase [Ruminococcaceae bacterium]|nr:RluA family pseudouridine synthase [Oscillospiraceae bacterium]
MALKPENDPLIERPLRMTIREQEDGKHLVRLILRRYPQIRPAALHQALRKRDIKNNGHRLRTDGPVKAGDQIVIYLPQDEAPAADTGPGYTIVKAAHPVWIVSKEPGISVQAGSGQKADGVTLLDALRRDLQQDIFLCHRLDRLTGGLIMVAAGEDNTRLVREQMRQGLVVKRYRCLVQGRPEEGQPVQAADGRMMLEITGWLEKQADTAQVYIHQTKQPGDQPIITRYCVERVLTHAGPDHGDVCELLVELVTGRTHQIRAHLAAIGHPLLGDGKYGRNVYNRHFQAGKGPIRHQELWATCLMFDPKCTGPLSCLAGQKIQIKPAYAWTGYKSF